MTARKRSRVPALRQLALAAACAASATGATAAEFDTGNPDLSLRWDNTLKYSAAWRVKGRDAALLGRPNTDDANQNFDKGLVSNRVDWLTEVEPHEVGDAQVDAVAQPLARRLDHRGRAVHADDATMGQALEERLGHPARAAPRVEDRLVAAQLEAGDDLAAERLHRRREPVVARTVPTACDGHGRTLSRTVVCWRSHVAGLVALGSARPSGFVALPAWLVREGVSRRLGRVGASIARAVLPCGRRTTTGQDGVRSRFGACA